MHVNRAVVDPLLDELAQTVLADEVYVGRDWQAIALVIQLDGRKRMFGYLWDTSGEWEAETPNGFAALDKACELQALMRQQDGTTWRCCLVQISRPGPKLSVTFDWHNPNAWAVEPSDLEQSVAALRPQ